jgi:hypothetical protein
MTAKKRLLPGASMRILALDGHYFIEPLRRMGHDVLWLGPNRASDVVLTETISLASLMRILGERAFTPDMVLWSDLCRPPSVMGIETLPAVTVGLSIDQYCNPWHVPYAASFDLMLVAQKDYLPMFAEANLGNRLEWSPLFCNPLKDRNPETPRDIPVSFVGTVTGSINTQRKKFLDDFAKHQPLVVRQGEYVPVFGASRIVLNQSAAGELNFRIFEAMACGAAVLTEETGNGLEDLFTHGHDILLYPRGNARAAAAVARTALGTQGLAALAARGKRSVLANHSSTARVRHILKRTAEIAPLGPTWRRHNQPLVRRTLGYAYTMLAVDDHLPLTPALRDFYAMVGHKMINSPQ